MPRTESAKRNPAAGSRSAARTVSEHWPEYLMEALGLGVFMVSACSFATLLEHPVSPVHQAIPNADLRRVFMGIAMGLTAVGLIYSPWGRRSGAHLNPAVTLAFVRLGKVCALDGAFYAAAQFAGAILAVTLMSLALGSALAHPAVGYVVTVPGMKGPLVAFIAEFVISFILMSVVLEVSNYPRSAPFTGWVAGALVALWIAIEAPFSGMSMNPARTFGSAFVAKQWSYAWIYAVAPLLAMVLAAEVHRFRLSRSADRTRRACAKLHHPDGVRCIFCRQGMGERAWRRGNLPATASIEKNDSEPTPHGEMGGPDGTVVS